MASSLIPINQATVEELQELRGIGPKRAERIVRYRLEVSKIINVYDLATAAGMSLKQANTLSMSLEWHGGQFKSASLVAPTLTFIGSYLLVFYGISEISFDLKSPTIMLYNASLLLIMIGCVSVTFEQLTSFANQGQVVSRFFVILSAASSLLGVAFMISLVSLNLYMDLSPPFTGKMTATTNFLIFVFFIVYLLYAPGIHLRWVNLHDLSAARNLDVAAVMFDVGQVIFAILILLLLVRANSGLWVEELFAIWASVMFVINGAEMLQGRSAYVSLLSDHEKAALRFVLAEDSANKSFNLAHRFMKTTGAVLMFAGVMILTFVVYELLIRNPASGNL
ncbi:MAG: helix-hairpin-helix domain-containing protein [Gammaproteobacteria bacterium]|nr:helix-hairpin-helix domain-containing protein [Gammaproteobacteria bacterium]